MHKRTLYISEESYQQVDSLSKANNTSHADILRQAVEQGLIAMKAKITPEKPASSYDPTMIIHNQTSQTPVETPPPLEVQTPPEEKVPSSNMKGYVENTIANALHKIFK